MRAALQRGKGPGVFDRSGPAGQRVGRQFQGQEIGSGVGRCERRGRIGAKAEAAVVVGLAEQENRSPARRAGPAQAVPDQRRTQAPALVVGMHRNRGQTQRGNGRGHARQQDMTRQATVEFRQQRHFRIAILTEAVDQVGFVRPPERSLDDGPDGGAIRRPFLPYADATGDGYSPSAAART